MTEADRDSRPDWVEFGTEDSLHQVRFFTRPWAQEANPESGDFSAYCTGFTHLHKTPKQTTVTELRWGKTSKPFHSITSEFESIEGFQAKRFADGSIKAADLRQSTISPEVFLEKHQVTAPITTAIAEGSFVR